VKSVKPTQTRPPAFAILAFHPFARYHPSTAASPAPFVTRFTMPAFTAPPALVFLHGPVGAGKLTIARELAALTGFALFHNHLVVEALLPLFEFGTPAFVRHRERLWLELMPEAIGAGRSLVFTFAPEKTVSTSFPTALAHHISLVGGRVRFAAVTCAETEIERRIAAPSRRETGKLSELGLYQRLKSENAFAYAPLPAEVTVDATASPPRSSALAIVAGLSLPLAR